MGNVSPFSLEDDSSGRRRGIQRSAFPRMQINSPSSRFYVKTTRSGRPRKYFRQGYSGNAEKVRSIVKSSFIRNNRDSTRHIVQHIDYMMKSKIDRDKEPETRKLFNRHGEEITREQGIEMALKNRGELAGHKLILSPGVNDIDMVDYARDQMRVLEEQLGVKLDYSFAYQRNTDHHHIHVQVPGQGERVFDFGDGPITEKIDIKLSRADFKAMREAGDRYVANHIYIDRMTDKVVEHDLLKDTFGQDARNRQYEYDSIARKDLGLEMSDHDRAVIKELGLEAQPRYEQKTEPQKEHHAKHEIRPPDFSKQLNQFLSEGEIGRILERVDNDPNWLAEKENKDPSDLRLTALENARGDERYQHFFKGLDIALTMQAAERQTDALYAGQSKQSTINERAEIERLLYDGSGRQLLEKFESVLRTESGSSDQENRIVEMNQAIDSILVHNVDRLAEKFRLANFESDVARDPFSQVEAAVIRLNEHQNALGALTRVMGYQSSETFADSFERLIRLQEGRDAIPDFQSKDERLAFLSQKLFEPEYADQMQHVELLKQRGFQLYSSYSTREEFAETKLEIRENQFALDSKILDLHRENSEFYSKYDGPADTHSKLFRQAIEEGNERQAAESSNNFHRAVMKLDDEYQNRESILPVHSRPSTDLDWEKTADEGPVTKEDKELNLDSEFRSELDGAVEDLVRGESLPLPGFDLDRLTRDLGEDFMHDPSEIQVQLNVDDELRRRRGDDDEEQSQMK